MGYLDKAGLSRAFTKLKTLIDGKADVGHTHSYAGSSSAGGAATSANKLNTNAGSGTQPVYFSNGIPVACTSYANASVKSATSATSATTATKLSTSAGSATQPVYFANGIPVATTYTIGKSVPSNAVFTDTKYNNVTTSASGLMTAADKQKLDALGGIVTITKSLTLKTDWQNTGISSDNLSTGTYVVQVSGLTSDDGLNTYHEIWSGVMSWYSSSTNGGGSADEILLHNAGHADNGNDIYLRTLRNSGGVLALQIAAKSNATKADNVVFKFRKLI